MARKRFHSTSITVMAWRYCMFWFAIVLGGSALFAQEVEIAAVASVEEVFVGESLDYQVEIRNSKNPAPPDMSKIRESFDVVETGDASRDQSSTMIINGRVSQRNIYSHIYQYRLTPKKSGNQTIPGAVATIDGQTLTSNTLPLQVSVPEAQDHVVAEIVIDQMRVYPSQPFDVTLRIFVKPIEGEARTDPVRPLKRRPPHIEISWLDPPDGLTTKEKSEWLQPMLAAEGYGFTLNDVSSRSGSFFDGPRAAVFDLAKGRETRDGLDGQPINYYTYELKSTFTAEKSGTYHFGPAVIKGGFAFAIRRNDYTAKKIVAIAAPKTLEVRDVPTPRPSNYCGGIGDYQWRISASPTKLRVGDPLTLTLQVERSPQSGSLELISAPDLASSAELMERFDLIDKNPTGRMDGTSKSFSYALRPKRADVQIPSMPIATFDPLAEKFVETTLPPIPLEVTEAARVSSGDLVGSFNVSSPKEIKARTEGIFQNRTDLASLRDERVSWPTLIGTAGACWVVAGAAIGWIAMQRRRSADPIGERRMLAKRNAIRRLNEAKGLVDSKSSEAMRLIRSAIIGLVADSLGLVEEGMTASDVDAALKNANASDDDRKGLVGVLESMEAAQYGAGNALDPKGMIETVSARLSRVASCLERRG